VKVDAAISKLKAHPDVARSLGADSGGRANGFQSLSVFADGAVKIWFHWGSRAFANWHELERWLASGTVPETWRDQ
jgi:hypothetical protein